MAQVFQPEGSHLPSSYIVIARGLLLVMNAKARDELRHPVYDKVHRDRSRAYHLSGDRRVPTVEALEASANNPYGTIFRVVLPSCQ